MHNLDYSIFPKLPNAKVNISEFCLGFKSIPACLMNRGTSPDVIIKSGLKNKWNFKRNKNQIKQNYQSQSMVRQERFQIRLQHYRERWSYTCSNMTCTLSQGKLLPDVPSRHVLWLKHIQHFPRDGKDAPYTYTYTHIQPYVHIHAYACIYT